MKMKREAEASLESFVATGFDSFLLSLGLIGRRDRYC